MRASPSSESSSAAGGPGAAKSTSAQRCRSPGGTPTCTSASRGPDQRGEPVAARLAAHASHHLADEMAVGVGVIGVARPGLPPRLGGGQRAGHRAPVPQVVVGQRRADGRHPCPVAQRVAQRRPLLAAGGELRPDGGDRVVEPHPPRVDELQRQQRHERLAHRVEVDQRVGSPGARAASSAHPPARSTTVSPSTTTHTAAPTSPRSAKLRANSSRTAPKRSSHRPDTATSTGRLCPGPARGASGGDEVRPLGLKAGRARRSG